MPPGDDERRKRHQARWLVEASAVGWMFPVAIGVGSLWGWSMDKWFGTRPWLTIIFTALGIIAAFVNLFRIGMRDDGAS